MDNNLIVIELPFDKFLWVISFILFFEKLCYQFHFELCPMISNNKDRPGHVSDKQYDKYKEYDEIKKWKYDKDHTKVDHNCSKQKQRSNSRYDPQGKLFLNLQNRENSLSCLLAGDGLYLESVNIVLNDRKRKHVRLVVGTHCRKVTALLVSHLVV